MSEDPPKRFIFNDADMKHFQESLAKQELLKLVAAMGKACGNTDSEYQYNPRAPLEKLSPAMAVLHGALSSIQESWVREEYPPEPQSAARFGNPAFRRWHERLKQQSIPIIATILEYSESYPGLQQYGDDVLETARMAGRRATTVGKSTSEIPESMDEPKKALVVELRAYLEACFGHPIRLDFGTGHECSFQVLLYCLCKIGCFGSTPDTPPEPDRLKAITISIWNAYLQITRQLQTDYMLEPAGSHGVWGLDDYHCLPFYFGACQLQGGEYEPSAVHDDALLNSSASERYLYFGCIKFIKTIKRGVPFFEHSPMLNDISNLPSWQKISKGLLRMFEGEVLDKRQVVQHFVFKNVFQATWTPSAVEQEAPQGTFTDTTAPMARAPWSHRPVGMPPPTKAPWAK